MPIKGKDQVVNEEGQDKEAYTVTFTNGAKQQLEELRDHFQKTSTEELVKYAIGVLERIREIEESKKPK